jgi:hypothetical protein
VSLIYVEYISPRPGVSIADFQRIAGRQQSAWVETFSDDQLILNLARTWRIGPHPAYMTIWYRPTAGLEQLDEWERLFESGRVDDIEDSINLVIQIESAGCYRPLLPPKAGERAPYYAEFFDIREGAAGTDVGAFFEDRERRYPDLQLNLVADRIGHLGPDPRCFSVWSAPSYAALATIVEELEDGDSPVRLVRAGLYSQLGREIL